MKQELLVQHIKDYLHIVDSRTIDSNTLGKLLNEILSLAKESDSSKILVDLSNSPIELDVMDYYKGGVEFAKLFFGFKVAFVFNEIKKNYSFGETVASNRGATIHLFTSEAEAIEWLTLEK
jgi:hypothetical protein